MKRPQYLPYLVFIGLISSFLLVTSHAWADCYRDCMQASGCWSTEPGVNVSYCSDTQARCSSDCRHSTDGGGKVYGAIAYSKKNGAYGYSHGWQNQKKAEKVALKNCQDNGKGCKSVVWFYNSCGAVASDGRHVAWGQASTRREAMQQAMDKCRKSYFSGKCEEVISHCSGV